MSNDRWTGADPTLRQLRVLGFLVLLGLFAFLVIDPRPDDPATVGSIMGGLLILLGFEVGIRWPRDGGGGGTKQ